MNENGTELEFGSDAQREDLQALIAMTLDRLAAPIFIKDETLRWVYANQAACALLGVAVEDLVGHTLEDVFPRHDAAFFGFYDRQVFADGKPVVLEWKMDWTGPERAFMVRKSRYETPCGRMYVVGYLSDVTAVKLSEKEKATQETYYHSLFENTGSGTAIFNNDGVVIQCNTRYERLTGYSRQEIVGIKSWRDFVLPEELDRLTDYHQRRLDSVNPPPSEYEVDFITKQGELRTTHAVINVIPETTDRVVSFIDISKRKAAEEALAESLKKYKALIETTDTGFVIVDAEGIVLDANDEYCRLAGRARQDVVGNTAKNWILPSEREACWEGFLDCLDRGKQRHFQTYHQHPDGKSIAIESNATRIESDGKKIVISLVRDISERKLAEDALRVSEQRLRSLVDSMPVLIHAYDSNGNVIFWNKECERVLGWTAQELFEQPESHARLYASASYYNRLLRESTAVSGAYCECEIPMVAKSGEIRMISWTSRAAEIPIPGWHIWETGVDVTDRRQYLAKLANLNRYLEALVEERTSALQKQTKALELANLKLQEVDASKSSFLNTVSHDIRTPLTSILGFTSLIEREFGRLFKSLVAQDAALEKRADRVTAHFKIIQDEGNRLKRLINDFLDLSKIESGTISWKDSPIDYSALAGKIRILSEQRCCRDGAVQFVLQFSENLPTLVMDPDRLLQVLLNLIDNACKFTQAGQVVLRADAPDPRQVRFMIKDTGIGLDKSELGRIFDAFFQAPQNDTLASGNRGTGLGLAVCRRIVEHYHGRIWGESEPGKGTTIFVLLPVAQQADD